MYCANVRLLPSLAAALALCLASPIPTSRGAPPDKTGWAVGDRLPALPTTGLKGALPDTAGQVVLVDFWASWCAPCRKSFPAMDALQREYGPQGFRVIGICVDEEEAAMTRYLDGHPVGFVTAWDAPRAGRLVEQADIRVMPTSFLIDRDGIIRWQHQGFEGKKTEQEYRVQIENLLSKGKTGHEK